MSRWWLYSWLVFLLDPKLKFELSGGTDIFAYSPDTLPSILFWASASYLSAPKMQSSEWLSMQTQTPWIQIPALLQWPSVSSSWKKANAFLIEMLSVGNEIMYIKCWVMGVLNKCEPLRLDHRMALYSQCFSGRYSLPFLVASLFSSQV